MVESANPNKNEYKPFKKSQVVEGASGIFIERSERARFNHPVKNENAKNAKRALNISVVIKNTFNGVDRFAVTFFSGYQQVFYGDTISKPELYVSLRTGLMSQRELSLNIPEEKHNKIWALLSPNPFMLPESPSREVVQSPMIVLFSNFVDPEGGSK